MPLVRGTDVRLRYLGLQSLSQVRSRSGEPVVPRALAHRLFLRELLEYRGCLEPARALEESSVSELHLLAESYREFADMALERAFDALACWYETKPLFGVFDRLRSNDAERASTALEYLGHVLPHAVFKPVSRIFERTQDKVAAVESEADTLAGWIRAAWKSDDAWLRACAVRAARHVQGFDLGLFTAAADDSPVVCAEIAALSVPARIRAIQAVPC
jgi:hypothetical protein